MWIHINKDIYIYMYSICIYMCMLYIYIYTYIYMYECIKEIQDTYGKLIPLIVNMIIEHAVLNDHNPVVFLLLLWSSDGSLSLFHAFCPLLHCYYLSEQSKLYFFWAGNRRCFRRGAKGTYFFHVHFWSKMIISTIIWSPRLFLNP